MAKTVIVETKDIAEFASHELLVAKLRAAGVNVYVVAEGLSAAKWNAINENLIGGLPSPGTLDGQGFRHDIDVAGVFEHLKPDLVLTGLASPINLGEKFGLAANARGVKLGYIVDVWGAETRSTAIPNFICTIDTYAQKGIESNARYQAAMPKVYRVGAPLVDRIAKVAHDPLVDSILSGFEMAVLLVGQNDATTPVAEGLVEALNTRCENEYILVPRFHPKFAGRDDLFLAWQRALGKAKGTVVYFPPVITTAQIMRSVNYVVSTYSTALIEAAAMGTLPVSWVSELGRKRMSEELGGITRFPLVEYSCAVEVESPDDFVNKVPDWKGKDYSAIVSAGQTMFPKDGKTIERIFGHVTAELETK